MISLNTLVGIFFILVRREFFFLKNLNLELLMCCHCTEIDNSRKLFVCLMVCFLEIMLTGLLIVTVLCHFICHTMLPVVKK